MNEREQHAVVDALINWFKSQDIEPLDSVPIMAMAMCVAVISAVGTKLSPLLKTDAQKRLATEEGIKAAAETVIETFNNMKISR